MRVLHIVKTADGAAWAAKQARVLCSLGVEVHVALPTLQGRCMRYWQASGAVIHEADVDLPVRQMWKLSKVLARVRTLVSQIQPDLIHTHFVGNTLSVRRALGKEHPIRRIYQVAGPLHLEHRLFREVEIGSAGESDVWIGSSRCIVERYWRANIHPRRVFLSYYGDELPPNPPGSELTVRDLACARREDFVVGNISWMYPPKRYLRQQVGLKAHEDIISALGMVIRRDPRVLGVFAGAEWGGGSAYELKLRRMAHTVAGDRIRFIGALPYEATHGAWRGFDLAVHLPVSENCGGVIEPLLCGVPVIASDVGGLPEVIVDKRSGRLVPPRNPEALADAILQAIASPLYAQELAARGGELVRTMFDVNRTGREVLAIYRHVLGLTERPPAPFDSRSFLSGMQRRERPPVSREHEALVVSD